MITRKCSHKKIKSEINIIPLLDILLVLVLIFIATSPVITNRVEVNLPDIANLNTVSNDVDPQVIVEVVGIDQYSLVIDHQRQDQLLSKQVVSKVRAYITDNPNTVLLIGGAKDIPYNEIIKTLNLLHQAGVESVGLITQAI